MKTKTLLLMIVFLVSGFAAAAMAAEAEPDSAGWRLINQDAKGNLLSVVPDDAEPSAAGIKRVWMKFETKAPNSPSPMLFLNEIDCANGLVKRLEVKLYNPTCATPGEPIQRMSFEGKWDRPSVGLEEVMQESVCSEGNTKSL